MTSARVELHHKKSVEGLTGSKKLAIGSLKPAKAAEQVSSLSPISNSSTLCGFSHMRRLVEMLINEFYRKKEISIKSVEKERQVDTLVDFYKMSLSHAKILNKLKGKQQKQGLVEKERHLLNFLNGTDKKSLLTLSKDSTTRKYGELAVLEEGTLRRAVEEYLVKSDNSRI